MKIRRKAGILSFKENRTVPHFKRVDLFYAFIIGHKQRGFPLYRRGDCKVSGRRIVYRARMSAAASPSFSSIDATESEEKDLSVNLISSAREKFLSANGFVRISARVTVEVTARRA